MEVSRRRHLSQFSALLDAAGDAGATILDFDCDAGGTGADHLLHGPGREIRPGRSHQLLRENGYFSRVERKELSAGDEQNFLIDCYFS